jgi:hypothetical protein
MTVTITYTDTLTGPVDVTRVSQHHRRGRWDTRLHRGSR